MDWANEEYVKVYRRETDDDLIMSWQALALWRAVMLKFDRAGLLGTKRGPRGLAVLTRIPIEVVEAALPELLEDGRLQVVPEGYFAPNFLAAQETPHSDKQRKRDERHRRADDARLNALRMIREPANVDVTCGHAESRGVTPSHAASQSVTLSSADPDPDPCPEPLLREPPARAHAIPPSTEQAPVAVAMPPQPIGKWHQRKAAWDAMLHADERIRAAGIEPNAPKLPAAPAGENEKLLAACVRELAASYGDDAIPEKLQHVVLVAEAEAKREGHRRWFKPAVIWDPKRAARAAATSLEEAATPHQSRERAGPRGSAARAPNVGRIEPAKPEEYQSGDVAL